MTPAQARLALRGRNPDVLTCIANLSNDEVFTPPELAKSILDIVAERWAAANGGESIWTNPNIKFLDPFTKSGVFLREITSRLAEGLSGEIPDLEKRVDHILTQQVYGIAITHLTSLLARRSVYCSKFANGPHSIAKSLTSVEGNIWFERMEHTWTGGTEWALAAEKSGKRIKKSKNGRCEFCAAPQLIFDRPDNLETHAYAFIHTHDIKARIAEIFGGDMQFDVIVGNPPYQMTGGGGGTNDSAIYHLFVQQAMRLEPRFLSMVIPSRWMAGGRGVGKFRSEFLDDERIRVLVDYENAKDVFPTVGIGGGICYFLWDRDNPGPCNCTYHRGGATIGPQPRVLNEFDVFVRDPRAVEILHKVTDGDESALEELVKWRHAIRISDQLQGLCSRCCAKERAGPSVCQRGDYSSSWGDVPADGHEEHPLD